MSTRITYLLPIVHAVNARVFSVFPICKVKKALKDKIIFLMHSFAKRKIFFENNVKLIEFYSVIDYDFIKLLH